MSILDNITERNENDDRYDRNNRNNNNNNNRDRDNNRNNNGNRDNYNKNNNRDRDNRNNNRDNNNGNRDNYNKNNNRDNRDNRNRDNNRDRNNRPEFNSKMAKVFAARGLSMKSYSSKQVKKMLVEGGLAEMLEDLKAWKKDGKRRPQYVLNAIWDLLFNAHVEKAIKKGTDSGEIDKKDLIYLYEEMLDFVCSHKKETFDQGIYDDELIEGMTAIYLNILKDANKKKAAKIQKKVEKITEEIAMNIAIYTTGENPKRSLYGLLNYLYFNVANVEGEQEIPLELSNENILNLFKRCYGKEKMNDVVLYLMLEKYKRNSFSFPKQTDLWAAIDDVMRDYLESLPVKDIKKILTRYAEERGRQEQNNKMHRRLGDRRNIHPEDYPKLTKAFNELEIDDISMKRFFRI